MSRQPNRFKLAPNWVTPLFDIDWTSRVDLSQPILTRRVCKECKRIYDGRRGSRWRWNKSTLFVGLFAEPLLLLFNTRRRWRLGNRPKRRRRRRWPPRVLGLVAPSVFDIKASTNSVGQGNPSSESIYLHPLFSYLFYSHFYLSILFPFSFLIIFFLSAFRSIRIKRRRQWKTSPSSAGNFWKPSEQVFSSFPLRL